MLCTHGDYIGAAAPPRTLPLAKHTWAAFWSGHFPAQVPLLLAAGPVVTSAARIKEIRKNTILIWSILIRDIHFTVYRCHTNIQDIHLRNIYIVQCTSLEYKYNKAIICQYLFIYIYIYSITNYIFIYIYSVGQRSTGINEHLINYHFI